MKNKPYSIEAEKAVLNILFRESNSEIGNNIITELSNTDFYDVANDELFKIATEIIMGGNEIDIPTISEKLEDSKLSARIPMDYVVEITNYEAMPFNYKNHVNTVKRYSVRRKLLKTVKTIETKAKGEGTPEELLEYAEKEILDLRNSSESNSDYKQIKEQTTEVLKNLEDIAQNPDKLRGVRTNFHRLDDLTNGLQKSDLILVAARPSVGKTSFAMNVVNNAALKDNAKCLVFSLEMSEEQLIQRSLCSVAKVNSTMARKGKLKANDWKKVLNAKKQFDNTTVFIDDNSLTTPMQVLSKARKIQRKEGLDLIMIDYLQLMTLGKGSKNDNRQQEISEITRTLKIAARELDVPIVLLSQLSRAVESRKGGRPVLSDLRESGAIEQDADIVMFLHNPSLYNDEEKDYSSETEEIDLLIAKHRNGALDNIKLNFVKPYTTFYNLNYDSNMKSIETELNKGSNTMEKIDNKEIDKIFG